MDNITGVMDALKNLFFYFALLGAAFSSLKICFFILDLRFFEFDRERNKVASEFNLSMDNSEDKRKINKYIIMQNVQAIVFFLFAAMLIYLLLLL